MHVYLCMYVYMYIYIYTYIHTQIHMHIYIYICIHTHIRLLYNKNLFATFQLFFCFFLFCFCHMGVIQIKLIRILQTDKPSKFNMQF